MTDRDFWILIRAAFLQIADAIDRRYQISDKYKT